MWAKANSKLSVQPVCPVMNSGRRPRAELLLQRRQRLHRQPVVLRQRGDEAVAAVRAEPDGVAGEEIAVVHEIDHVAPGVAGHEEAFDLDSVDFEHLSVAQQRLFVGNVHLRQLVQVVDDLAANLTREIAVLDFTDV